VLKAAYANTPFKTPAEIRGPSLKQIHAQQKADEEMKGLLASDSPVAGAAAFAKGLAAGASLPLVFGAVPWVMEVGQVYGDTRAQAELAELLKSRGVGGEAATQQAAALQNYLKAQAKMPQGESLAKIQKSMATYISDKVPVPLSSRKDAEKAFRRAAKAEGLAKAEIRRRIQAGAVQEIPPPNLGTGALRPAQLRGVLEDASKAFSKRTTSAIPTFAKAHGIHAARHLARAGVPAAILGGTAGVVNYLRHRSRRQTLDKLRREQARRTHYAR
jgi:hypothetical protein